MKDLVVFIDPDASVNEGLSLMRHRYTNSIIINKSDDSPFHSAMVGNLFGQHRSGVACTND